MVNVCLFDLDHTLLKGYFTHRQSYLYALNKIFGINADIHTINFHGSTDPLILHDLAEHYGITEEKIKEKMPEMKEIMTNYFLENVTDSEGVLMQGAKEALQYFKEKKIPIGAVTGNLEQIGWRKLELVGLKDYLTFGGFASDSPYRWEMIDFALKKINYTKSKDEVWLFGDTKKDIIAAKKAKVKVCAIATGSYSYKQLEELNPDLVIESFESKKFKEFFK